MMSRTPLPMTRFEVKYFIAPDARIALTQILRAKMNSDSHGASGRAGYAVSSLYFDTAAFENYFDKKDGVLHRLKFRIRSYGEDSGAIFLESKERAADHTLKRRASLDENERRALSSGRHIDRLKEDPVFQSFWRTRAFRGIRPNVVIAYRRTAFVGRDGRGLRVTVDQHATVARSHGHGLTGRSNRPLLPPGRSILELKFDERMPSWLHGIVQRFELRQASISKYCMAIEKVYGQRFLARSLAATES